MGGGGIVGIRTIQDTGILTTRYITVDHLGSVSEVTDEVGNVDERVGEVQGCNSAARGRMPEAAYDAFGERRNPATWQPYATMPDLTDITDKGYTGQQQLDAVGLIHMNGRVYDPQIGRFISPDPTVPDPLYSQSFNRYAYVSNNPLSSIDPSGFQDIYAGYPTPPPIELCSAACGGTPICQPGMCTEQLGAIEVTHSIAPTDVPPPPVPVTPLPPVDSSPSQIPDGNLTAPGAPNSPQNGSSGQNPNDDGCGGCTDPNNVNSFQNAGPVPFQTVGSLGDLSGWGGTGKLRGISPVEIPGPSGHNIGSPDSGASHPPGSGGVPIPWVNPTGGQVRGCGAWGCGYFGAPRDNGNRRHLGTDYLATPGQNVRAVTSGTVTKIGYPYADDLSFRYIRVSASNGYMAEEMYVNPAQGVDVGLPVNAGDIIGTAQDLDGRYPSIPDHVHVGIWLNGNPVDPATLIPPIDQPPNP